ncbi:hypothetical protein J4Q44_G00170520 [Coregonus suidteri]|uniref:Myb/SANT-like DNA-binding domain-containing protein n=1 Tax=Coregonus suidteri TaxID=861788 RepID=A0AAN8QUJ9_9TELE
MKPCAGSKMLTAATRSRFTREQTRILLREVHARRFSIYGTPTKTFRVSNARSAWEQVAERVSSTTVGLRKTANQCRKRINDLKRRQGIRIFENRLPKPVCNLTDNDSTSSIKIEHAEHQIGDGLNIKAEMAGSFQAGTPQHVPQPDPTQASSFQAPQVSSPQMNQSQGQGLGQGQLLRAHIPLINFQPLIHVQPASQDFTVLCQVHQAGYTMLHKEITDTKNSMEEMLHPVLSSISHSLERLASAVERLAGPGESLLQTVTPITVPLQHRLNGPSYTDSTGPHPL